MSTLTLHYLFLLGGWGVLFIIAWKKPIAVGRIHTALWAWFIASIIMFIARYYTWQWLALVSLTVALVGLSICYQTMHLWLQRRAHWLGLVIWLLWLTTVSLTLAQLFIMWFNASA